MNSEDMAFKSLVNKTEYITRNKEFRTKGTEKSQVSSKKV